MRKGRESVTVKLCSIYLSESKTEQGICCMLREHVHARRKRIERTRVKNNRMFFRTIFTFRCVPERSQLGRKSSEEGDADGPRKANPPMKADQPNGPYWFVNFLPRQGNLLKKIQKRVNSFTN